MKKEELIQNANMRLNSLQKRRIRYGVADAVLLCLPYVTLVFWSVFQSEKLELAIALFVIVVGFFVARFFLAKEYRRAIVEESLFHNELDLFSNNGRGYNKEDANEVFSKYLSREVTISNELYEAVEEG